MTQLYERSGLGEREQPAFQPDFVPAPRAPANRCAGEHLDAVHGVRGAWTY